MLYIIGKQFLFKIFGAVLGLTDKEQKIKTKII